MRRHLLLSGGPGHDFDATSAAVASVVDGLGATTTVVHEPVDAVAALEGSGDWDLLTVNALRWRMDEPRYAAQRARWAVSLDGDELAAIERHVTGGGGLLALHTAVICFDGDPMWSHLLGGVWHWGRSDHPDLGPLDVFPTSDGLTHPVTAGVGPFTVHDELYRSLDLDDDVVPLLSASADGDVHPVLWARRLGGGRVVTSLLGHGPESLAVPAHAALLAGAAGWAARSAPVIEGAAT